MKNIFYLLLLLLTGAIQGVAQGSLARDGMVVYHKGDKAAAVIEFPYSPDLVEQSFRDYFSSKGSKADKSKGFTLFRNVRLGDESTSPADVFIKVERKSRQEKNSSLVYFISGKPGEDISGRSPSDHFQLEESKLFLNSLAPYFLAKNTEAEIAAQAELVNAAEKKSAKLIDEQGDLEKKIRALEKKLEENKTDQAKQKELIAKENEILEALKAKRQSQ